MSLQTDPTPAELGLMKNEDREGKGKVLVMVEFNHKTSKKYLSYV